MAELAAFNREIQVRFLSGEQKLFHSLREKHISSKDGMQVRVLLRDRFKGFTYRHVLNRKQCLF